MTALLHPLVTPSDYTQLEDGSYALPQSDNYLALDGSTCDDPHLGALHYNRCLIRYLKQQKNSDVGSLRYQHIFSRYAKNRRVKKVLEVAATLRANQAAAATNAQPAEPNAFNSFTPIESVLFFHVPTELL